MKSTQDIQLKLLSPMATMEMIQFMQASQLSLKRSLKEEKAMIESIQLNTSIYLMEALMNQAHNGSLILSQALQMPQTSILELQ